MGFIFLKLPGRSLQISEKTKQKLFKEIKYVNTDSIDCGTNNAEKSALKI